MLMNARPRFALTAFEALVPTQRAEFLHQRFVDMANNEVISWGVFRPKAESTDDWEQNLNDFNGDNFPLDSLYCGEHQDIASTHQSQFMNMSKVFSHSEIDESQLPSYGSSATLQQIYDEPIAGMSCLEDPSPMLGNSYSQWSFGRRSGSFTEFSNAQNRPRNSPYQTNGADLNSFGSSSSLAQPQSPHQNIMGASIGDMQIDKTSPSTVYSNYSSPNTSIDSRSLAYLSPNAYEMSTKNAWWPDHSPHNKDQCQEIYGVLVSHDGLQRVHNQQQQDGLWNLRHGSTNDWMLAQDGPVTVSPKALTLNVHSDPISPSGSSQGRALSLSDSNSGSSSGDENSDFSVREPSSVMRPQQPIRQPRQLLPDSIPEPHRRVPILPSNGPARSPRKRLQKLKAGNDAGIESTPLQSSSKVKPNSRRAIEPTRQAVLAPKRVESEPTDSSAKPSNEASQASQKPQRDRDDFLVRSKLAGMSYKDIRRQGNFTEAESTLRGRFRTLTKHKTARVRKPEWCENDVRLLKRAVRKLTGGVPDPSRCKVPWKQVADYIADNGGSYHFGNATCRKRWDDLQLQSKS